MREEVFKIHKYPLGHKVDKQLLVSIKDIFLQFDKSFFQNIQNIHQYPQKNMPYH